MNDPIGDAVRSIVDGHVVLTRHLAQKGHFPRHRYFAVYFAGDAKCDGRKHFRQALRVREMMAVYREAEDLINIGAYKMGSNVRI